MGLELGLGVELGFGLARLFATVTSWRCRCLAGGGNQANWKQTHTQTAEASVRSEESATASDAAPTPPRPLIDGSRYQEAVFEGWLLRPLVRAKKTCSGSGWTLCSGYVNASEHKREISEMAHRSGQEQHPVQMQTGHRHLVVPVIKYKYCSSSDKEFVVMQRLPLWSLFLSDSSFLFPDIISDATSLLPVSGKANGFWLTGRSARAELVLVEKGFFPFKHPPFQQGAGTEQQNERVQELALTFRQSR